ncbi:MAG: hypothetical protein NT128_02150 [Proteobacteria bacterium]|nr:hypothetical protein [Pseudomonadota bacterium]
MVRENISMPRILVLQSYGSDYSWTHNVDIGIKRILKKENAIGVRWHYMDTKNHPEEDYKKKIAVVSRNVVDQFKPTVIIAVDDDAQEYVAKYYNNDPKIKIVFAGVNGTREQYGFDKANNVTGILERVPIEGLVDTLQLLSGSKKDIKIIHIGDSSKTVGFDDVFLHKYKNWKNIKILPSILVSTFDNWKDAIKKGGEVADYIIISNYRKIYKAPGSKEKVNPKEIMKWSMENATVPIIGLNTFVFEDGANLAIATSPYEQGEVAGNFAVQIIKNGVLSPHTKTKQFIVGVDEASTLPGGQFSKLPKTYSAYALYSRTFRTVQKS